ncbi:hypothetical protein [Photobacterium swingsii]|uniref:hypothetical protein n=1 Tax=Photobacterium swingsii TaxID=680026 RepID=UPI0040698489
MANSNECWINAQSEREANFYAKQLQLFELDIYDDFLKETLDNKNIILSKTIKHDKLSSGISNIVKKLKTLYEQSKIDNYDWFWLDSNQTRAINWKWGYLQLNKQVRINSRYRKNDIDLDKLNIAALKSSSHTPEERYNQIIRSFEENSTSLQTLEEIENELLFKWHKVKDHNEFVSFLDINNDIQCKWVIEHLNKQRAVSRKLKSLFKPTFDKDNYWCAIAIFDLIDDIRDKELLLIKMRKAWTQKKYRSKENSKKAQTISMSPDTKRKLDEIVAQTDGKICDTIERLINEEYKQLNRKHSYRD